MQYVIERLCSAQPTLDNLQSLRANCEYEASSTVLVPSDLALRYRVLVRVRCPRNSEGWFEAVVSGPAAGFAAAVVSRRRFVESLDAA